MNPNAVCNVTHTTIGTTVIESKQFGTTIVYGWEYAMAIKDNQFTMIEELEKREIFVQPHWTYYDTLTAYLDIYTNISEKAVQDTKELLRRGW